MKRLLPLALLVTVPLLAQQATGSHLPTGVSDILADFRQAAGLNWLRIAEAAGVRLFGWLSLAELAIATGMLLLSTSDVATWTSEFARRLLVIGAMYALLTMGPGLAGQVIDSYLRIGEQASGLTGGISASNIIADCVNIVSALIIEASQKAGEIHILTALALAFSAVAIVYSFFKLVKAFVIARVESYITITAAAIQLAWGGSRFTSTYAERYVGGAIANAVRLLAVTLVIGIERSLMPGWLEQTAAIGNDGYTNGYVRLLLLVISILLFCALVDIEKWAGVIFGGQPQFSHGDLTNTYAPIMAAGTSLVAAGASTYLMLHQAGMFAASGAASAMSGAAGGFNGGGNASGAGYAGMSYAAALPSGFSGSGGSSRASQLAAPPARPQRYLPPPA